MRFNPPPGWPPAPEGWSPSEGWLPDKSWPTVPPGWKLWIEDPRPPAPPLAQEAMPSAPREPSVIGRSLLRNTIFASVASIMGSIGFQYIIDTGTTFSGFVTGILAAFIFFWCLWTPAALLELYITKRHSRHWVFWPHGLAMAAAVIAIAGNEANPGQSPMFRHVLSIQAATVGLLYYLICALAFLTPVSIAILIMNVMASQTQRDSASSTTKYHQAAVSNLSVRAHFARLHTTPSRDAAALAVSIVTAIASLVQGLDIRDIGRTVLALAAGAAGLYALFKLPNVRRSSNETTSQQLRAVGNHSKPPSPPPGAQSGL
jgi:hypothetical protein